MNRIAMVLSMIVVLVLVAGASFWAGTNVGHAQAQDELNQQSNFFTSRGVNPNGGGGGGTGGAGGGAGAQGGAGGFAGRGGARNGATGTVDKIDGSTITMTTGQGDSVTVNISNTTPIVKSVAGGPTDLTVGGHILVIGTRSGNNIAATGIQITDQPAGVQGIFRGNRPTRTPTPPPAPTQ